ncbi:hypothetical protein [Enterococcus saigonensis]|uniref:hypothetical protein n=1 Tax=Enterococcus saigonensis TaxID=1805431 RepID=UPI001566173C|nr:hypothetical protein [Enterococcus saigonensis]
MENFNHKYPQFAQYLRQKYSQTTKDQIVTWGHFAILALFGLMLKFSFTGQLLLIFIFITFAAVVKGPMMILYSSIYLFLTSLFPPIGIILSALLFVLSLLELKRNWQLNLTAFFFYGVPLLSTLLLKFSSSDPFWLKNVLLLIGVIAFHFILQKFYRKGFTSLSLLWFLIAMPYELLLFIIPKKNSRLRHNSSKKL